MRVCGSDGCARCPSQARRMRSVRAGSAVCRETVAQSTSHTTRRPPARKARYTSPSAAGTSATYSSTCTDRAASKLASSTGNEVAPPRGTRRCRALAAMRRRREHRLAAVDADHPAVGSDLLEQLGDVEPGSAAHVHDAFTRGDPERVADELPAAAHRVCHRPLRAVARCSRRIPAGSCAHRSGSHRTKRGSPGHLPLDPRKRPSSPSGSKSRARIGRAHALVTRGVAARPPLDEEQSSPAGPRRDRRLECHRLHPSTSPAMRRPDDQNPALRPA